MVFKYRAAENFINKIGIETGLWHLAPSLLGSFESLIEYTRVSESCVIERESWKKSARSWMDLEFQRIGNLLSTNDPLVVLYKIYEAESKI